MLVRLRESYLIGTNPVILDVIVGEGQKGLTEVLLNGATIASGASIHGLSLPAISGQKLRVTSTVTDTNPDTNNTSVTYTLSGGKETQSFVSAHTVGSAGDTVDYDAIFLLI
jgi:hypothetical protein